MLEASQIRAARALLDWHQSELAKRAKIGLATLQRLERAPVGPVMAHVSTVVRVVECLEKAGIMFIERDPNGGLGVRLKR
jgi:predicted transcriptional regulator